MAERKSDHDQRGQTDQQQTSRSPATARQPREPERGAGQEQCEQAHQGDQVGGAHLGDEDKVRVRSGVIRSWRSPAASAVQGDARPGWIAAHMAP